jgi:hypothetical protein
MAAMDHRLLEALRMIRTGDFVYGVCCHKSHTNYSYNFIDSLLVTELHR